MGFIKVCPKCNTVNPAKLTECSNCHKDLTRERKYTEEKYQLMLKEKEEAKNAENSENAGNSESDEGSTGNEKTAGGTMRMAYICDNCGQPNDTRRSVCISCGESLSGLIPSPWPESESESESGTGGQDTETDDETIESSDFVLRDVTGDYFLLFSEGEYNIGKRENGAEFFASKDFISGLHAKITVENGALYIVDYSTNGTYINGGRINKGERVRLVAGQDLLGLGSSRTSDFLPQAAYFKVEMG